MAAMAAGSDRTTAHIVVDAHKCGAEHRFAAIYRGAVPHGLSIHVVGADALKER